MGLAGPKRRTKISNDPNNTAWARSTDGYGHKIMASQGWKPGQYLGAENANHSDHYTQANASHIRVMLRDDNLGLGAQKGKSNAETFGLSTLSGIFGRLNGKSDVEVQKQQDTQRDWQLRSYQAQKYGFMKFVSGGLLVGDKMELPEQQKAVETVVKPVNGEAAAGQKKSKKRKVEEDDAEESSKPKKRKSKIANGVAAEANEEVEETAAGRKSKKDRKKRRADESSADSSAEASAAKPSKQDTKLKKISDSEDAPLDDEKRSKQAKRARKEERRRRKEEKRAKNAAKETSQEQSPDSSSEEEEVAKAVQPPAAQQMFAGSRHAVRQRYIQQKRMASMNAQAMSEILMLKAGA